MNRTAKRAWQGLAQFLVFLLICLLLPGWSLRYWRAWIYFAVFGGCIVAITFYLQRYDPALLERRLAAGPSAEKEPLQRVIQAIASAAFLGTFVVSSLDHRYGWSSVGGWLAALGDVLVAVGLWIVFLTFRENSYAAAVIETSKDQHVVSTGPYALVRHPMYAGAFLMLGGTPLALGSGWAFVCVLVLVATIVVRLIDEERFLSRSLAGYQAYRDKVRYRLVPFVW